MLKDIDSHRIKVSRTYRRDRAILVYEQMLKENRKTTIYITKREVYLFHSFKEDRGLANMVSLFSNIDYLWAMIG